MFVVVIVNHTIFCTFTGSETGGGSVSRSHDMSSDVTLQTCDTWGGLAPPTRVQAVPSDTVSAEYIIQAVQYIEWSDIRMVSCVCLCVYIIGQ